MRGLPDRGPARRARDVLPARRPDLRSRACSSSCRPTCRPRASSASTRTSRRTATAGSRTPSGSSRRPSAARSLDLSRSSSRSPATTATSSSTCVARGHPGARRRAGAQHRSRRRGQGHPDPERVLRRRRRRQADRRRVGTGRLRRRQQRLRPRPGPRTTSPRAWRRCSRPAGCSRSRSRYLVRLIERNEFDTIYHEHFMYYTVLTRRGGPGSTRPARPRRGGARRPMADRSDCGWSTQDDARPSSPSVGAIEARERDAGYGSTRWATADLPERVEATKRDLLAFLIAERRRGSTIAGYGAPGKGNTLLNYCGIRTDLVDFLVDRNPYKHGRFTRRARTSRSCRRSTSTRSGRT